MKTDLLMDFTVDRENNQLHVTREFAAPVPLVWAAWTTAKLLDQWWAPKPWQARTKTMDFREGGHWHYAMIGPEGEAHWGWADYRTIDPEKGFTASDAFCDEEGNVNREVPQAKWTTQFSETGGRTTVKMVTTYTSLEDLETILIMGMKEGLTMALTNLDALLAEQ